jgi:hypothetical protein
MAGIGYVFQKKIVYRYIRIIVEMPKNLKFYHIDTYKKYLMDCNAAFYNHNQAPEYDKRNCIYEEAHAIKWLYEVNPAPVSIKVPKDNLDVIQSQMDKYKGIGFPEKLGLIYGGVILRRHNEKDCIKTMEDWWSEIRYHSKRDQLSFNYVAWKNKFKFNYIDGYMRDNEYFNFLKHNKHK